MLDVYVPNKEGKKALYRLELLLGNTGPTQISIYHRRTEERKTKTAMIRSVKTYGFGFDCGTGILTYASIHTGDFTEPQFRWAETREEEYEEEKIPGVCYLQAIRYVERIYGSLTEEKEKSTTYKEKDKYARFLSPLERILGREK